MKNLFKAIIVILILFTCHSITFAQDFEGRVSYKMNAGGQEMNMTYLLKGDQVRIDVNAAPMGQSSIIFKDKKMIMLIPMQKMYMEMPINKLNKKDDESEEIPDGIVKTNETKEILGYDCVKVIYKDENSDVVMWLTEELGNFMPMQNPMNPQKKKWEEFLGGSNFFPLEMIAKSKEGNVTMKATEVKEESIAENKFQIPSGYKKMDMGLGR